jgi:hypothetical protein
MQIPEREQLCKQVEFYFSEKNLTRDNVLRSLMGQGSDGYVPIKTLIKHKRVDSPSVPAIIEAVKLSKVLELHPSEPKVRRKGLFSLPGREKKPKLQATKAKTQLPYICHLDTSQKLVAFPAASPDKLPELTGALIASFPNCKGLAVNSECICTYQFDLEAGGILHVLTDARSFAVEGFVSLLESIAIRPDNNVIAMSFLDGVLEAFDLDREGAKCLSYKGYSPYELIKWNPTVWSVLATSASDEVTIWELPTTDQLFPRRYKTFVQQYKVLDLSFHPDQSELLTIAMERGSVKTFNYETEEVLFEVMAHLYNLKLYGPTLSVLPVTQACLMTAGKSNNELILWKWPDPSSSHIFMLNSHLEKGVEYAFERVVVFSQKAQYCALLTLDDVDANAKFATITEFALKAPATSATLRSEHELVVLHAGEIWIYALPSSRAVEAEREVEEVKVEAKPEAKVPEVDYFPDLKQDISCFGKKLDDWGVSLEGACRGIAEQVEGLLKEPDEDEWLCSEIYLQTQEAITDLMLPALDTGVSELLSQFEGSFTDGSRENWEHFLHQTSRLSWAAETQTAVTKMLGSIVSVIWKNPVSLLKEFGRQIAAGQKRLKKHCDKGNSNRHAPELFESGQHEDASLESRRSGVLPAVLQVLQALSPQS